MNISTGRFDYGVLQRNRSNQSDALITGMTTGTGDVHARIGKLGRWLHSWVQPDGASWVSQSFGLGR